MSIEDPSPPGPDRGRAADDLPGLGPLERQVMEVLWRSVEGSVRDIQEALDGDLAYTTLMTTMDRLFRKGLLVRRKDGRAFVYAARVTERELRQGAARRLLARLLGADSESAHPILSSIVESVSEQDRALLDDLERLVRAKRRALARREP